MPNAQPLCLSASYTSRDVNVKCKSKELRFNPAIMLEAITKIEARVLQTINRQLQHYREKMKIGSSFIFNIIKIQQLYDKHCGPLFCQELEVRKPKNAFWPLDVGD